MCIEPDIESTLLQQCINSGQVSASQLVKHAATDRFDETPSPVFDAMRNSGDPDLDPAMQPSTASGKRELPLNVEFSASYLDGVMEDEPAEIRKQWECIRKYLASAAPADVVKDAELVWPKKLTPALDHVLGWPNFKCSPVAHVFQAAGKEIPLKAEREQAFVLHWLVTLVLTHGEKWTEAFDTEINAMFDRMRSESGKGGKL